jgi:hypothetical protein
VGLTLGAVTLAQGPPPLKPLGDDPDELKPLQPPKSEPKQQDKKPSEPVGPLEKEPFKGLKDAVGPEKKGEDPKEVIARIAKNMEAVEGRLKKKDTGKDTHQIQDKIIEDLDKLIQQSAEQQKQQQQQKKNCQNGQCEKPGSKSSNKENSKSNPQNQNNKGGKGQQPSPKTSDKGNQPAQQPPQNQSDKSQQAKKSGQQPKPGQQKKTGQQGQIAKGQKPGTKDDKNKQTVGTDKKDDKDKKGQTGFTTLNSKDKEKSKETAFKAKTLADVDGFMGHLPKTEREEADRYSNDRLMPRYEQMLEQYFNRISQNQKKGGRK